MSGRNRSKNKTRKPPKKDNTPFQKVIFLAVVATIIIGCVAGIIVYLRTTGGGGGILNPGDNNNNNNNDPPDDDEDPVFDFSIIDLDGNIFTLSEVSTDLVLLDFMFIDCPWCDQQYPELNKVKTNYPSDRLTILSLDIQPDQDSPEDLQEKWDYYGNTWAIGYDTEGLAEKYGVTGAPTLVLLDNNGNHIQTLPGFTEYDVIASVLQDQG